MAPRKRKPRIDPRTIARTMGEIVANTGLTEAQVAAIMADLGFVPIYDGDIEGWDAEAVAVFLAGRQMRLFP